MAGGATQPYLDATKNAVYTTPTAWENIAANWEASVFDSVQTAEWIAAGIQSTLIAATLTTAADAALVRPYFPPGTTPQPSLEVVMMSISCVKGMVQTLAHPPRTQDVIDLLTEFWAQADAYGVTAAATIPK